MSKRKKTIKQKYTAHARRHALKLLERAGAGVPSNIKNKDLMVMLIKLTNTCETSIVGWYLSGKATTRPVPYKKKKPKKEDFYKSREWRELRYQALIQYGRQCLCCGAKPPTVVLHVDHVRPRSLYPELELDIHNLQILCEDCNLGKSNKSDDDFRNLQNTVTD